MDISPALLVFLNETNIKLETENKLLINTIDNLENYIKKLIGTYAHICENCNHIVTDSQNLCNLCAQKSIKSIEKLL